MPRERIGCSVMPYEVQVGWGHGGEVQVGTCESEGRSLVWSLYGDEENRVILGRGILEAVSELVTAPATVQPENVSEDTLKELATSVLNHMDVQGYYTGLWSWLDRDGCNQLIKKLRKARDATFGRDE